MSIGSHLPTIIAPTTTFDLATLLDVKGDLGITTASGIEIARIARLISQCSALVATYCNRVFAKQTYRDTLRTVSNEPFIVLKHCPVISISAIAVDGDDPLTAADYEFEADTGFLYALDGDDARSEWSGGKIVVDYVAGFVLPGMAGTRTLPHEIEAAVLRLVKLRRLALDRDLLIRSEEETGVGSTTYWVPGPDESGIPKDIVQDLDFYRIPVIA